MNSIHRLAYFGNPAPVGWRCGAGSAFITGEEKEVTGIAKDVAIFDRTIVCEISQSELEVLTRRARRSLGDEMLGKVDFSLVSDYLEKAESDSEIMTQEPVPTRVHTLQKLSIYSTFKF